MSEWSGVKSWVNDVITGVGGMNDYERYELVVWTESDRVAAGEWVIRCLANPKCKGSEEVMQAIMAQRELKK